MKNLLAPEHRAALGFVDAPGTMLAFDYDGALAPIVDDPSQAQLRPRTRELLEKVATRWPCVVVSGRKQSDVVKRLRGAGLAEVIGNHGIEPWKASEEFLVAVQSWVERMREAARPFAGAHVEDKGFTLAVHYRLVAPAEHDRAQAAIVEAAHTLEGVRVLGGKEVVNLVPEGAPHKGAAVLAAVERHACAGALFLGDDETDEDVFALGDPHVMGVRVGEGLSQAEWFVESQEHVDLLLERMLLRRGAGGGSG